ncbi:MAG: hypothetical protein HZY76_23020 [Anaerolineae bacterium]|nr:MAG: hypothetical protein HZY76_23020 [Anaerolineae bacterium]
MTRPKLIALTLCALLTLLLPTAISAATPHQIGGPPGIGSGSAGTGTNLVQTIRATAPLLTYTFDTNDDTWSLGSDAQSARSIARPTRDATRHDKQPHLVAERLPLGDFYLEMDTTHLAGAVDNLFGVIFRLQDDANFYLAVVSSDGQFTLGKYVDDSFATLARWTPPMR